MSAGYRAVENNKKEELTFNFSSVGMTNKISMTNKKPRSRPFNVTRCEEATLYAVSVVVLISVYASSGLKLLQFCIITMPVFLQYKYKYLYV